VFCPYHQCSGSHLRQCDSETEEVRRRTLSRSAWTLFLFSNNSFLLPSKVLWRTARNSIASVEMIDSVPLGGESVKCTPLGRSGIVCDVYTGGGCLVVTGYTDTVLIYRDERNTDNYSPIFPRVDCEFPTIGSMFRVSASTPRVY
jgi:hypothetical protein